MTLRRTATTLAAALCVALPACDAEPSGPGALVATVTGSPLGGAVLEIVGPGIRGFEGLSGTQVYAAPLASEPNGYRVMVVDMGGTGTLRFEIRVDDVGMEDPRMTVVSAAGTDNLTLLTAGIETRVER